LPAKHCAFAGCSFTAASAEDLQAHLKAQHEAALKTAASLLPIFSTTSNATRSPQAETQQWMLKLQSAYNEAVAVKSRESAPLAGLSIDRRCLYAYEKNLQESPPEALICFACARRFPHVPAFERNDIAWVHPLTRVDEQDAPESHKFLHMNSNELADIMGYDAYLSRYGSLPGGPDLGGSTRSRVRRLEGDGELRKRVG